MSHQLALMFMVLSIGSLMDVARPLYNIEAEKYYHLSRAALFQSPIVEQPTLAAAQTLVCTIAYWTSCDIWSDHIVTQYLMAFYLFLAERYRMGVGSRWAYMGLAVKLGISMSDLSNSLLVES